MSSKEKHQEFIMQKGPFKIDCNLAIFSNEEIGVLERWGHWFKALVEDELKPFTESQKRFIEVFNGESDPFTLEEIAWFKYQGRKAVEEKYGDRLKVSYEEEVDTFYSREDWKKINQITYGTISQIHNKGLSEK
jgi:uncharacterized protein YifE (UPF0438 family)